MKPAASIYTKKLSNGLTIIGESRPQSKSVSIGYFVKTGARDEVGREAGLSHFLEHMMFKGTNTRSSLDITFQMGMLGAQANAYTSEESTVFYATVLPANFAPMLDLLSDMLRPALDTNEFEMERKVILEEIALYQDRPQYCLFEQALESYFHGHTAGNSVLGSTQSISEVTRNEMSDYFKRRYSPANMALVFSGNFNWENAVTQAEELTSQWQPFEAGRKLTPFQRAAVETKIFRKKDLIQPHLLWITNGPSAQEEDRYPLTLLAMIIGDGAGSRFYWDLVETGLAETVVMDCDEKDGTGCVYIYAVTDMERQQQVSERVQTIVRDIDTITEDEFSRAKAKLLSRIVFSGELSHGRLFALGNDWLYRGAARTLSDIVDAVKKVQLSDVRQALSRYPLKDWSMYKLLPE